jgi:hypothetical protein
MAPGGRGMAIVVGREARTGRWFSYPVSDRLDDMTDAQVERSELRDNDAQEDDATEAGRFVLSCSIALRFAACSAFRVSSRPVWDENIYN